MCLLRSTLCGRERLLINCRIRKFARSAPQRGLACRVAVAMAPVATIKTCAVSRRVFDRSTRSPKLALRSVLKTALQAQQEDILVTGAGDGATTEVDGTREIPREV